MQWVNEQTETNCKSVPVKCGTGREAFESKKLRVRPAWPDERGEFPKGFPVTATRWLLGVDRLPAVHPRPSSRKRVVESLVMHVQNHDPLSDMANFH